MNSASLTGSYFSNSPVFYSAITSSRGKSPASLKGGRVFGRDDKPHKCEVCNKGFRFPYLLKNHLNMHKGERPHVCTHAGCGKVFAWDTSLRKHQKTHISANASLVKVVKKPSIMLPQKSCSDTSFFNSEGIDEHTGRSDYPISRNDTDSTNSDACWLGWALRCLSIPSLTPCTNNVSSCNPEWIDEHTGRSDHQIMGEAAHNLPAPPEDTAPLACSEVDNVNFSSATALPENDINSIITTLSKGPTGEQSPTNCLDELPPQIWTRSFSSYELFR